MTAPDPAAAAIRLPRRKPMATTRRVSLLSREIRVSLSTAAVEILFDLASVLSEGQLDGETYLGSTMITIDLARAQGRVSDACDAASALRVHELLAGDPRVRERARAIALAEAERRSGTPLTAAAVELRTRLSGVHLHLDVDVEGAVSARAGEP